MVAGMPALSTGAGVGVVVGVLVGCGVIVAVVVGCAVAAAVCIGGWVEHALNSRGTTHIWDKTASRNT